MKNDKTIPEYQKSSFNARNIALKNYERSAHQHSPPPMPESVPGYTTLFKHSDFVAPESMSLGLLLDDIMPSARGCGSSTAQQRDAARKKYGMSELDKESGEDERRRGEIRGPSDSGFRIIAISS